MMKRQKVRIYMVYINLKGKLMSKENFRQMKGT